ncbi:MAG: hypothetical protein RBT11_13625 [Desulfobacterales bacterium]|nr:hypothetical protein [Desulfobacterales bacterium]
MKKYGLKILLIAIGIAFGCAGTGWTQDRYDRRQDRSHRNSYDYRQNEHNRYNDYRHDDHKRYNHYRQNDRNRYYNNYRHDNYKRYHHYRHNDCSPYCYRRHNTYDRNVLLFGFLPPLPPPPPFLWPFIRGH